MSSLALTILGQLQQSPPLLFVDNECAIGLATSSVRPRKSKSIDMRLDWLKERVSQRFFRLVFLPGLINPADVLTKILTIYHHIAALHFLHGNPYPISFPPNSFLITPHLHDRSSCRDAVHDRDQSLSRRLTSLYPMSVSVRIASNTHMPCPCSFPSLEQGNQRTRQPRTRCRMLVF